MKPVVALLGRPNVGKSTVINAIAGKKKTKIANKPGVTKIKQRVTTHRHLELLDTPGILWPREDEETFENLALIGAIKDEVLDLETLSLSLLKKLIYFLFTAVLIFNYLRNYTTYRNDVLSSVHSQGTNRLKENLKMYTCLRIEGFLF